MESSQDPLTQGASTSSTSNKGVERVYHQKTAQEEVEVIEYFQGKKVRSFSIKAGKMNGPMESYDEKGGLESLLFYKEGLLHGVCSFFNQGRKALEMNFFEGKQEGESLSYHENDVLQVSSFYQGGLLEGEQRIFDPHGMLLKTSHYSQGRLDGEVITYFPQGKKMCEKQCYQADLLEGKSFFFDPEGNVLKENSYRRGKLDGYQREYHPVPPKQPEAILAKESFYEEGQLKWERFYDLRGREVH